MKTADLNEVIEDMKAGVYDFTKDGKCSNCGNCCSDWLPISHEEAREIKRYIKKHGIKEQKHFAPTLKQPDIDLTCPFRNNAESRCEIYEVRPEICRQFQCDKPKKQIELDRERFAKIHHVFSMRFLFFEKEHK